MKISQPAPTVSDLWDAQVAALVTATSIGKLLVDNVDSPISTAKADLTTLEARLSAARALLLDNLDAAISTRSVLAFAGFRCCVALAAGTTYTPPAQTFGTCMNNYGRWQDGSLMCYEFWDGAAWIAGQQNVSMQDTPSFAQDSATNFRIINDSGVALKLSMHGQTWS